MPQTSNSPNQVRAAETAAAAAELQTGLWPLVRLFSQTETSVSAGRGSSYGTRRRSPRVGGTAAASADSNSVLLPKRRILCSAADVEPGLAAADLATQ